MANEYTPQFSVLLSHALHICFWRQSRPLWKAKFTFISYLCNWITYVIKSLIIYLIYNVIHLISGIWELFPKSLNFQTSLWFRKRSLDTDWMSFWLCPHIHLGRGIVQKDTKCQHPRGRDINTTAFGTINSLVIFSWHPSSVCLSRT